MCEKREKENSTRKFCWRRLKVVVVLFFFFFSLRETYIEEEVRACACGCCWWFFLSLSLSCVCRSDGYSCRHTVVTHFTVPTDFPSVPTCVCVLVLPRRRASQAVIHLWVARFSLSLSLLTVVKKYMVSVWAEKHMSLFLGGGGLRLIWRLNFPLLLHSLLDNLTDASHYGNYT